jgi:hypothetical protein
MAATDSRQEFIAKLRYELEDASITIDAYRNHNHDVAKVAEGRESLCLELLEWLGEAEG